MITTKHNEALIRAIEITFDEVEMMINVMPHIKAPGPDGFTVKFFQSCWPIIGENVWRGMEELRQP